MLVCGSQNAIRTSRDAKRVLISNVMAILIILFRGIPKLIDWKSIVLFNTKRI